MFQASLVLSLIWAVLGLIVGALGLGARLRPEAWGPQGRLIMLGVGIVGALAGGWLGALLLGRFFGTMAALWIAVAVVVAAPLLTGRAMAKTPHP
jgi:uncharacterized membrane protein YeaQ/YmgE (transglycosylase-associated protein family)